MAQFKEVDDINFPFEVGTLPRQDMAFKFADFLNSRGIKATAKPGFGVNYIVYVAQEKDVSIAKLELLRFGNNPFAREYNQASWAQGRKVKREKVIGDNSWLSFSMGTYRWTPFSVTSGLEILCLLLFVLSLVPGIEQALLSSLAWFSWGQITESFELWRVVTPILLHSGLLHIAFNMVMFEAFARPVERFMGHGKILYLVLSIAIFSNILQFIFLQGQGIFGGMSGVVYGVIGYMAIISRRHDIPEALRLPPGLFMVSVIFIGIGFFMSGIANLCHLGGFIMGVLLAFADYKRPIRY